MMTTARDASAQNAPRRPAQIPAARSQWLKQEVIDLATDRFGESIVTDRSGAYEQITIVAREGA